MSKPVIREDADSSFRLWMNALQSVRGHRPLWPTLLGAALDEEFQRQREHPESYSGDVFKDRDSHPLEDGEREERLVARLFRATQSGDGCLSLEGERVWLLGYQWPNQGGVREKSRRADLIGLTREGALVVFEAKRSDGEPPLVALVEGLDYLACLLRPDNFSKIQSGFGQWVDKPEKVVPDGFEGVVPDRTARPTLVILAPQSYFGGRQARSIRGRDWPLLAMLGDSFMKSVALRFAATDFSAPVLEKPVFPVTK